MMQTSGPIDGRLLLLAEDNPVNQMVAVKLLKKLGCEVETVENGLLALEAVKAKKYDLVLMDWQMPVMDGLEATRRIIAELKDAAPPIVALTANAMAGDRETCLAAGMVDYVSKPIRLPVLQEAIERALSRQALAS